MQDFKKILTQWYNENKRDLPWRKTSDPYKIWLSEVMLQQTRVSQGLPYYLTFTEAFPTVYELAAAKEQEVLKLWQGLGYYSRARNLHHTAKVVAQDYNGVFPTTYKELKTLKGIGDYTASAIASICHEEPKAVVDGNVYRVLSRYLGIDVPTNSTEGKKIFKNKAELLLDVNNPGLYNQAIMEFGALHCKPKNPLCNSCPLQISCVAFQQGKVADLPIKLKKVKVRERHLNYFVFLSNNSSTVLQQRTEKGIWKKLFEFPLIETQKEMQKNQIMKEEKIQIAGIKPEDLYAFNTKSIKHQLTHQRLMVKFWIVQKNELSKVLKKPDRLIVKYEDIKDFPVPVVIDNFLNAFEYKQ